jgi:hypothetical protein
LRCIVCRWANKEPAVRTTDKIRNVEIRAIYLFLS